MSFEMWCIVELFGHSRLAGKVTEQTIGGETFIRVDVPETKTDKAFTKLYGKGAIYGMTPVDEATCRLAVESYKVAPIEVWRLEIPTKAALVSGENEHDSFDPERDDPDDGYPDDQDEDDDELVDIDDDDDTPMLRDTVRGF